jgi:alpha-tubulin suppressor-like RCC1 family protein
MLLRLVARRAIVRALRFASRLTLAASIACGSGNESGSTTGPSNPPPSSADPFVSVGLSRQSACLLNTRGQTYCWGSNGLGELGTNGAPSLSPVSLPVQGPSFGAISSWVNTTCALTGSGAPMCWGYLPQTSILIASTLAKVPTAVTASVAFKSITMGYFYACGLDAGGAAYCWGLNGIGQLGVGDSTGRATPTAVRGGLVFKSIEAGEEVTCGVTTQGLAYCWGSNGFGELGIGAASSAPSVQPAPVAGNLTFTSLTVGAASVCGITVDGTAYCWGDNHSGQLGLGFAANASVATPTAVTGGLKFKSIRLSRSNTFGHSTCGITLDDTAYCWGINENGALGSSVQGRCNTFAPDSTGAFPPCNVTPAPVPGLPPVALIVPSFEFSCAVTVARQVMCWGDNSVGELGDGTFTSRATPAVVIGLTDVP